MGKTVDQLLNEISSRELTEWLAYNEIEPIGEGRADLRAGIIASTMAEIHRDPKKRQKPFEAAEFMPDFDRAGAADDEQTPEQQLTIVEMINMAFGGKDLRGG